MKVPVNLVFQEATSRWVGTAKPHLTCSQPLSPLYITPSLLLTQLIGGVLVAVAAASAHLNLLRLSSMVVWSGQAKLLLHIRDLLNGQLGQLLGDLEGPLLLNVGLGKDDIDLLKITTSGLDVEEVGEGNADKVNQSEEQVDTPGALRREDWSEHDDCEVGDPVGASGSRGGHGTSAERVDLGGVDPGQRQRSKGEENDEQEDTDSGTLGVLGVLVDQATHSDNERQTLTSETDQEQVTTTDPLNHEERGNSGKGVNSSENTTDNKSHLVLHTKVVLEKESRVVNSSVTTSELLEELARATNHHTLELLGLAEGEEGLPAGSLLGLGSLHVSLHKVEVTEDILSVRRAVVELGHNLKGFLILALHNEPTRRLGQHKSTDSDHNGEQDLESDRESPLDGGLDVRKTEIKPVSDEGTDSNNSTLKADQETTVVGLGALRLPDRDSGSIHAVSETRDDTTDNELTETP